MKYGTERELDEYKNKLSIEQFNVFIADFDNNERNMYGEHYRAYKSSDNKWNVLLNDIVVANIQLSDYRLYMSAGKSEYNQDTIYFENFIRLTKVEHLFSKEVVFESFDVNRFADLFFLNLNKCRLYAINNILKELVNEVNDVSKLSDPKHIPDRIIWNETSNEYSYAIIFPPNFFDEEYYSICSDIKRRIEKTNMFANWLNSEKETFYYASGSKEINASINTMDDIKAAFEEMKEKAYAVYNSVVEQHKYFMNIAEGPHIILKQALHDVKGITYVASKTFVPVIHNNSVTFKSPYTNDIITISISDYSVISIHDFEKYFGDKTPLLLTTNNQ